MSSRGMALTVLCLAAALAPTTAAAAPPSPAALPDLTLTKADGPGFAYVAGSFVVFNTSRNLGQAEAAPSTSRFYLSPDAGRSADDVLLVGSEPLPNLRVGALTNKQASVTVPSGVAPGRYYVIGCADDLGVVAEADETNNCVASTATTELTTSVPNLRAVFTVAEPARLAVGDTLYLETTVNQTNSRTSTGYTGARFFLSTDALRGPGDRALPEPVKVPGLGYDVDWEITKSVTLPTIAPGDYYVLGCADIPDRTVETSETDNCDATSTRIVVTG